ncbi:P-selectin glycoprotein ligand 1 [Rhincodon typus]|uniref:P-selectin glycoprotein ligand 1 n=1 Tax=Rhincodon typus TaxID=259920 RepID=UPI0009A38B00|nr:P-selectin glycoprotein ligand 1 [Rhincodon typus]
MPLMWCSLPVLLAVVGGLVVMEQTTRETLEVINSTEPVSDGDTQNPETFPASSATSPPDYLDSTSLLSPSLTSTPLPDETAQLTSTTGSLTTSPSNYSATGAPSVSTQDLKTSQEATSQLSEVSSFMNLQTMNDVNQDSSPMKGTAHWTTETGGTETEVSEATLTSTAVTNTSELGGYVHPDVKVKTITLPSSTLTSIKKLPTSPYPVTTAPPVVTTTIKATESIPLKPTVPFVSKIIKTTTRSNNRLTTAQVTGKKISLVAQCLIAIAILAGVCTVFVICTVVLCTKLSSQRQNYRVNRSNGTELICISALLPEDERKLRRKMKAKRLRDLKETTIGRNSDSDEDDLTLHSFVTEH